MTERAVCYAIPCTQAMTVVIAGSPLPTALRGTTVMVKLSQVVDRFIAMLVVSASAVVSPE